MSSVSCCQQQESAIQTMELRNYFSLFCLHQETQLVFIYLPITSHILGAFVNSQVQGHKEVRVHEWALFFFSLHIFPSPQRHQFENWWMQSSHLDNGARSCCCQMRSLMSANKFLCLFIAFHFRKMFFENEKQAVCISWIEWNQSVTLSRKLMATVSHSVNRGLTSLFSVLCQVTFVWALLLLRMKNEGLIQLISRRRS